MTDGVVHVYQDNEGIFHYQVRAYRQKNAKSGPALCWLSVSDMRQVSWFDVGDPRGKVHYERACGDCRDALTF